MMTGKASDPALEPLIAYLQESRGLDFRAYKRPSLRRRIERRMIDVGCADFDTYLGFLEAHPQEYVDLLNTVLINVTAFFRDAESWGTLAGNVIPQILDATPTGPIRLWSAGCASGEEAYSLAVLMAEAIGIENLPERVKIYATDLDEVALSNARAAIYPARALDSVAPDLVEKYFVPVSGGFTPHRDVRKAVIFGRHDIVKDAPISKVNLIACRNLLIYLSIETQAAVLSRLHGALTESGFLFLGRAETQLARSKLFEPVDLQSRVFRKRPQALKRGSSGGRATADDNQVGKLSPPSRLTEDLINLSPAAHIVIDTEWRVVFANATARRMFDVAESDMGQPLRDLVISYSPAELRGRIEEVARSGRSMRLDNVENRRSGQDRQRIAVDVVPLYTQQARHYATALSFHDVTQHHRLRIELQEAQERLETTIEELQSSNEELETANEELQSSNEELETINEGLHTSNEELQSANEDLRASTEAASEYRRYSESILRSIDAGIVVLDMHLNVSSWNRWSENAWGLRGDEVVGAPFLTLEIGLPVSKLRGDLQTVLREDQRAVVRELEAIDRRGRRMAVRVTVSPLVFDVDQVHGLVVIVEDMSERRRAEDASGQLGRLISMSTNQVYVLDALTLHFIYVNLGAEEKLGYATKALRQLTLFDLMPDVSSGQFAALIEPLRKQQKTDIVFETRLARRDGTAFPAELCLQLLDHEAPPVLVAMVHDVTERKILAAPT
ncbi:MAG: putative methyltransferase, chemotaxis regulator [Rhodospirillales bacterium]|nr:putative methyltransferase, chemotaxis regulator [Rhodospirillales bacterium]